ncbi:MAG: YkgJ family cysteine cluster protein [Steroidobacteraceae bacterium]
MSTRLAGISAGNFGEWLEVMRAVLRGERDADVPCGDCVGCCVSSYPIPLRPTDHVALQQVPARHLRLPADSTAGLARMGYREDGSCPLLCAGACSIYNDRPQTCRDYDCRIYAAAELMPDGERPVIHQRVSAWRFEFISPEEHDAAEAVRQAAAFIRSHSALFPVAMRADSATATAVLALKTWSLFRNSARPPGTGESPEQAVQRVIDAARQFDQKA